MSTKSKGFTLIELMAAMAMALIVLTLGVPSFAQAMRSTRLSNAANDLLAGITVARSEAVRRGDTVTVCATDHNWNQWKIEAGGGVIKQGEVAKLAVTGPGDCIQYGGMGFRLDGGGAVDLKLCESDSHQARTINVNAVGRASVVAGTC